MLIKLWINKEVIHKN